MTENTQPGAEQMAREARARWETIRREEHAVLLEWLNAIRLEIDAQGTSVSLDTIRSFAVSALKGETPHWYTPEYRAKLTRA
jgi:hypothetical protein